MSAALPSNALQRTACRAGTSSGMGAQGTHGCVRWELQLLCSAPPQDGGRPSSPSSGAGRWAEIAAGQPRDPRRTHGHGEGEPGASAAPPPCAQRGEAAHQSHSVPWQRQPGAQRGHHAAHPPRVPPGQPSARRPPRQLQPSPQMGGTGKEWGRGQPAGAAAPKETQSIPGAAQGTPQSLTGTAPGPTARPAPRMRAQLKSLALM